MKRVVDVFLVWLLLDLGVATGPRLLEILLEEDKGQPHCCSNTNEKISRVKGKGSKGNV